MTELFLFHSLILLLQRQEQDKLVLQNEFYQLIKQDNMLPVDFCKELFFHYRMFDEALLFLFYKREYHDLLTLIRSEFEKSKDGGKYWLKKFVKYCKKINESDHGNEDFTIAHTGWLFKVDVTLALECFKKFKQQDPFKSEQVLRHLKDHGGLRACLKYLEYLTIECAITDPVIHTELACLYVQYINSNLNDCTQGDTLDTDKADND